MPPDLQVVFRRLPPSELELARVRARFVALQRISDDLVRCHVDIERVPAGHGDRYRIFVQLTLLRGDVIRVEEDDCVEHGEIARAIDHAFDAVTRRLNRRAPPVWHARALAH